MPSRIDPHRDPDEDAVPDTEWDIRIDDDPWQDTGGQSGGA